MKVASFFSWAPRVVALGVCALSLAASPAVFADGKAPVDAGKQGGNYFDYTAENGGIPKDLSSKVFIAQNLDKQLPLGLNFRDESGKNVKLGDYFGDKPVLLTMLQLTCDQTCSAQFSAMDSLFNDPQFGFALGKEFTVLTVSIDPREGFLLAQDAKAQRMEALDNKAGGKAGWRFLTGDQKNIKALAGALGVNYIWETNSKQYVHPDNLILATPDGKISRYFMQLTYASRDVRFSIIEASKEKIGTFVDKIALSCFHYNPVTGKYSFQIMAFLRLFGAAFVLGSLASIFLMMRADKKRNGGGASGLGGPQPQQT